jgi:hypothetical protein
LISLDINQIQSRVRTGDAPGAIRSRWLLRGLDSTGKLSAETVMGSDDRAVRGWHIEAGFFLETR